MSKRHLVLVGMMGAGKTTVGRRSAKRLGRTFVDTDDLVEEASGMRVAEVFERQGEPAFHALEHEAVVRVCASDEPKVIACGGGVVLDPDNRAALRAAGLVVWLHATSSVLEDRVRPQGAARPLIAPVDGTTPVETLERIATERESLYLDVADVPVDTDDRTAEQVVDEVVRAFEAAS